MSVGTPNVSATSAVELRAAMGTFATGVTVVTTTDPLGEPYGTTANAVSSVSLEPPLVLVCLKDTSQTLGAVRASGFFALNILCEGQGSVAERFARPAAHDTWRGVERRAGTALDVPLLADAAAALECVIHDVLDGGDHRIVLGRVVAIDRAAPTAPLVFHHGRFTRLERDTEPPSEGASR